MKINLKELLPSKTERQCVDCLKVGAIVGLYPFSTNLHVYRKCETEECENNFDNNNGKQWCEIKPYEDYSATELREILKWVTETKGIVHMFDGGEVVEGWNGDDLWRFQRLDPKNDHNPDDFMPKRDYASMRIRAVLQHADSRKIKLAEASKKAIDDKNTPT